MNYIINPKTVEEAANNVKFQCDNVSSWLYLKDYQCAKIKADCMMEAFEVLFKMLNSGNSKNDQCQSQNPPTEASVKEPEGQRPKRIP